MEDFFLVLKIRFEMNHKKFIVLKNHLIYSDFLFNFMALDI